MHQTKKFKRTLILMLSVAICMLAIICCMQNAYAHTHEINASENCVSDNALEYQCNIKEQQKNEFVQEIFCGFDHKTESENFSVYGNKSDNIWTIVRGSKLTIKSKRGLKIEKIILRGPALGYMKITRGKVESFTPHEHISYINIDSDETTIWTNSLGTGNWISTIEITATNY